MMRFPLMPSGGARLRLWSATTIVTAGTLVTMALGAAPASARTNAYRQINLVSDQHGMAKLTDPDLVNAWGLAASPGIERQARITAVGGRQRLGQGDALPGQRARGEQGRLVVSVTGAAPTGQVFNADQSAFVVKDKQGHSGASVFLFDTENGTIDGWSPGVNPNGSQPSTRTEIGRNNGANAVYKGLAIAQL